MSRADAHSTGLTPKQRRFIAEFLVDLNGTRAAIRAGYSPKTANEQAAQLMAKPAVKAEIDARIAARSQRTQIDADWVLKRLALEVDADLADLYDDNNNLKAVSEWPEVWRRGLVAGVDINALFEGTGKDRVQIGYVKKIRLADRIRIIELIGRHIKVNAFQETVHYTGLDALGDRLERAFKRIGNPDDRDLIDVTASASALADVAIERSERAVRSLPATAASHEHDAAETAPPVTQPPTGDWTYSPILPTQQELAGNDYASMSDSLLASRKP
ncbi:MAG: terminase small subunit [Rhizobiales bacterium]|nr:terminase small subunit [Hyphomicrobiales bacterium]